MSLREGAVQRLAQSLSDSICGEDCIYDEGCMADHVAEAAAALDALCDYLTEHADEWKAASYETVADADPDVFGAAALAVLRESADV